jgi:hypothetical protein
VRLDPQKFGGRRPPNVTDADLTTLLSNRLGGITFGSLHGTKVTADPDKQADYPSDPTLRPFTRILYWQTLRCMYNARQQGWPTAYLPQLDLASITPGYADAMEVWKDEGGGDSVSSAAASDAAGLST